MAAARIADVTGTPGFVVAGYFVNGAQPIQAFRRIVKHALENP
jgi:predicted DsbA family dithiol-disulfide isomerase